MGRRRLYRRSRDRHDGRGSGTGNHPCSDRSSGTRQSRRPVIPAACSHYRDCAGHFARECNSHDRWRFAFHHLRQPRMLGDLVTCEPEPPCAPTSSLRRWRSNQPRSMQSAGALRSPVALLYVGRSQTRTAHSMRRSGKVLNEQTTTHSIAVLHGTGAIGDRSRLAAPVDRLCQPQF